MDLRALEAFVVLAEEQHFHRAAARLHMTQPALSQQTKRLEQNLKAQLFVRTTRSVELTNAGRVLLAEARQVLAAAARARSAVAHASSGELGSVRIGFVASAAIDLVPRILLAVQRRWPRLDLELVEATTGQQLEALRAGELDIGIAREVPPHPDHHLTHLLDEPLVVALHEDHPLAHHERLALRDLAHQPFIAPPRESAPLLTDHLGALFSAAGVHPETAHQALQFPTILGLVAANMGIAVVPAAMQALRLPALVYRPISDTAATSHISVVTTANRPRTALVDNVLSVMGTAVEHPAG